MPLNSTNVLRGDVARPVVVEPWKHVETLLCGFCAALLLLWVQARYALVWVVGESMEPTLRSGSLVVVNKTAYREASPCRDDLVVALYRDELIAKRVVGLPGETVEVKQGVVLVDGVARSEAHPILAGTMTISPGTLFPDRYALLGDNRSLPAGVLVHAVVSKHALMGKVVAQWPGRARKIILSDLLYSRPHVQATDRHAALVPPALWRGYGLGACGRANPKPTRRPNAG